MHQKTGIIIVATVETCVQPVAALHASVVQALLSSQLIVVKEHTLPAPQTSRCSIVIVTAKACWWLCGNGNVVYVMKFIRILI